MNITLITGIFPPDIGGPATYIRKLAQSLVEQGHRVSVLTPGEDDGKRLQFPVIRVSRAYPLPVRLMLVFFLLIRTGWRSDTWYINGLELPAVLAGKLLRKRLVMKIVGDYAWERAINANLTSDGIDAFQHTKQPWKVELHKRLRSWYTRQVCTVITPSRYLKSLVCGWGVPENRVQVIYNAVEAIAEDLVTKADIRKQLGLSSDARLVCTVGRLVPWKGIKVLIQVIANFDPSVTLLIVGDGPEKNKLTELSQRLSVTPRIRFVGKAERKQVLSYMQAADVFVLNTAYEGFSHVLLEAMMVGVPVITTSAGGNPELVTDGENGLLAGFNHEEAFFDCISRILDDPVLQTKLSEAGKHSAQSYSWERLLDKTIEVIKTQ